MPTPPADRSLVVAALAVPALLTLAFVVLLGRVAQLQVAPSTDLMRELEPRTTHRPDTPVRGDLCDRRGRPLSVTRFGYRVIVDPTILTQPDTVVERLAGAMGVDVEPLAARLAAAVAENERIAIRAAPPAAPDTFLQRWLPSLFKNARAVRPPSTRIVTVSAGSPSAEPSGDSNHADAPPRRGTKPIRYLPISVVLPDARIDAVRALKIPGVGFERRPVREYPGGDDTASIVGLVGFEDAGMMGAEKRLNDQLAGDPGTVSYVRDKRGRPLWVEPGQIQPAEPGRDVNLSIDLELQRIALEELERGVQDADAAGGRLVMLDPLTGEILAMADVVRDVPGLAGFPWQDAPKPKRGNAAPPPTAPPAKTPQANFPALHVAPLGTAARYATIRPDPDRQRHPALGRNRCVEDIYEPGSTFKPFVWSVITEAGLAKPEEVFDTEGGRWVTSYGRHIDDVTRRASMTWAEVLINSSNIGMIKGAERLAPAQLHDVPVRFGFGKPTGLGLQGEASGIVTPLAKWTRFSHTSYAYGHEIAVTPVQMVRAFSAFCRPGQLSGTIPQIHLSAVAPPAAAALVGPDELQKGIVYRVLKPETALLTRRTMKGVADSVESKMKLVKTPDCDTPWRYHMFGKSGTAEIPLSDPPEGKRRPRSMAYFDGQYNSSFIAGAPLDDPKLVVLVVIDDPGPSAIHQKHHYGTYVAGPVVRRVIERALAYLGVAPSPTPVEATADEIAALHAIAR